MIRADAEVLARGRDFQNGLLYDLARALAPLATGHTLALVVDDAGVREDLETWARLTGHALVEETPMAGRTRFVIRKGRVEGVPDDRALGQRLWIYSNFDCNLSCDYCCVRSSPQAEPGRLALDVVEAAVDEAAGLGFHQVFLTGGEPFLNPDLGRIALACADRMPTTLLTNAMVFQGKRLETLEGLPRDRLALQVSLDSPTPAHHDAHRGRGSWRRARDGIDLARGLGFRVRVAATGVPEADLPAMMALLDAMEIAPEDRVLRPVARRGNAQGGLVLARSDLQPELTITARGAYWHPVGATDDDFLITRDILPLARALERARAMVEKDEAFAQRVAEVFNCG